MRTASVVALAAASGAAAWASDSGDGLNGPDGVPLAVAVPYDLDFIRKSSDRDELARSAGLAEFRGESMQRLVLVNGVEYGTGVTGIVNDKLYISSNLATVAGLECGEMLQAGEVSVCAVGARNFWTEGDRLFVEQADSGSSASFKPEPAPELNPATVAFLNYDTNFIVKPNGSVAVFGTLQPGLRLKENAFDVQASYYQRVNTEVGRIGSENQITVTSFAYRREWFERRLRMVAGRTQSPGRGLMGGEQFDGISVERFNSDDVGSVPSAGPRPITGFADGPGVVQYRVGDKVYKQLPVREGNFEIGGDFLIDVPREGRLEFVGLDGVARELSAPSDISGQFAFYRPGDYSFDVQAGRMRGLDGDRPFAALGGRYGLSRDVTVDLGFSTTDRAFAVGGTISTRLPGALGALNLAGAASRSWSVPGSKFASTIDASYFNRFGEISLDLSHRQYFNGGYRGLGFTGTLIARSGIVQNTRAAIGLPLPLPGNDAAVRIVAERSSYRDAPHENQSIQVDLSRSFGRLGSGSLVGRFGRDQFGKSYSTLMLNWVIPFGGRNGISLTGNSSKNDGGPRENRYGATFWGSSGGAYGLGSNYQISIDQDARIAADANLRGRLGNLSAMLTRNPGENLFGSVGMRGGLVVAGGGLIATRAVSDSILVVRAKELGGSEIYIPPDLEGRTRFNGAGFGVLTDLPSYRRVNFAFDESNLPLGMEISQEQLSGSLRPYRAYVVDVPVKRLQPLRLFPRIPSDAFGRGNAVSGNSFAPIELDGSIYFNSWPEPGLPLELTWQTEKGVFSCQIELPTAPEPQADGSVFDLVELRDVECKSTEEK